MASEEKSAWIMLILAIVVYPVYAGWVLSTLDGAAITDAAYQIPMLATIGGSIVLSILLHMLFAARVGKRDVRERDIHRFGENMGYGFITVGGLAALVLAGFEADTFWIANAVYLCFVLSAIVSSIAKVIAYRTGLPRW
ncbi:MAG TPA: hypothetical protein VNR36_00070 [Pseudolysinimonas sp.]|nr:hypothetical protein [Pseudolysinimonas sp.]